jgi:hypothetical protein
VYLVSSFQSSTQFRSTTTTMFGAFWFSLLVTEYVFMAMLVSFRWRLYVIGSATTFIMFQISGSFCVFLDSIENVNSNNGVTIIFYFVVFFCVSIIFSNCWFFILRLLATTSSSDHVSSISSHWCSHWHDSFRLSVYSFNLSRHHDNDLIDIDRG